MLKVSKTFVGLLALFSLLSDTSFVYIDHASCTSLLHLLCSFPEAHEYTSWTGRWSGWGSGHTHTARRHSDHSRPGGLSQRRLLHLRLFLSLPAQSQPARAEAVTLTTRRTRAAIRGGRGSHCSCCCLVVGARRPREERCSCIQEKLGGRLRHQASHCCC